MGKVFALVVAAGQSRRMEGQDKLLAELNGRAVLWHSLNTLANLPEIDGIVLVTSKVELISQLVHKDWQFAKVQQICLGGATRPESVWQGLQKLPPEAEIVLIHDAARPLVSSESILALLEAVRQDGAATLAMPVKDTIKIADANGLVASTPPRKNLWLTQTPQGFKLDLLRKAYQKAENLASFTDDASIAEAAGIPVKLVEGSYHNLKITTPEDLAIAEVLQRRGN